MQTYDECAATEASQQVFNGGCGLSLLQDAGKLD